MNRLDKTDENEEAIVQEYGAYGFIKKDASEVASGLQEYEALKHSYKSIRYEERFYDMCLTTFFKILALESDRGRILRDVVELNFREPQDLALGNALLETIICGIQEEREHVVEFEEFIGGMCSKMTMKLFKGIFLETADESLINMRLDFVILQLKLTAMYVERKIELGEEIVKKEAFAFAREYFYGTVGLFERYPFLESELLYILRATCMVDAFVNNQVSSKIAEVLSIVGDLEISGSSLTKLYISMVHMSRHSPEDFGSLLVVLFTTECMICIDTSSRNRVIRVLQDMMGQRSMTEVFRKIFHILRERDTQERLAMVHNFLYFLSNIKLSKDAGDINSIFLKFVTRQMETVDVYCDFILLNEIDVLPHSFSAPADFAFMQKFYAALFKKVRKEKHSMRHVDRLVTEFMNYFLATKNRSLACILPLIPYIPVKKDTFHVLYEIYAFLFERDSVDHVGFFLLKTPALVGISADLYYDVKYHPLLATRLNLLGTCPQKLVFLGIVFYCESKKLHNFNYTGILEYIEDMDTIRTCKEGIIAVMDLIHRSYVSRSYKYTLAYVNALFSVALKPQTIETTLVIIEIILRHVLMKDNAVIFVKEVHQQFQELFLLLRSKKFLGAEVLGSYVRLYRQVLDRIKCAPNFYNYVVLCLADLSFFDGDFVRSHFRSFNDLYSHTLSRMRIIEDFPECFFVEDGCEGMDHAHDQLRFELSDDTRNDLESGGFSKKLMIDEDLLSLDSDGRESQIGIRCSTGESGSHLGLEDGAAGVPDKDEARGRRVQPGAGGSAYKIHTDISRSMLSLASSTGNFSLISSTSSLGSLDLRALSRGVRQKEASVSWLIDIIYTRRSQSHMIRTVLDLLKLRLEEMFEYEDLYILLRAYNILSIRENDTDHFLKYALHRGLDFKTDPDICHKLSLETSGFYKFFFHSLHCVVSDLTLAETIPFPEKKEPLSKFSIVDLILIQNTYKRNIVQKMLAKSNAPSYRSYFFDMDNLGIVDCLTAIKRCKDASIVDAALRKLLLLREEIFFYVPQMVQMLRHSSGSEVVLSALLELSKNKFVSHQLIWNLKANLYKAKGVKDDCYDVFSLCIEQIMNAMSGEEREFFRREDVFVRELMDVSRRLLSYVNATKDEKRRRLAEYLSKMDLEPDLYIPYNPECRIVELIGGSARVLQSRAKTPFMLSFKVQEKNQTSIRSLIFKFGDDCRQDMLALQLISMFKTIFEQANLDIYLYPYRVVATDTNCGIIEVVSNSKSRDQIGRENINNLSEYFEYKFGFRESEKYLAALYNFASSLAGSSLVVYFLNIKDRHNGNILIDDRGRMVHIDFGYMLETSPGNLNIEAPLKLTKEIEELLGGTSGEAFRIYEDLMIKGFLALRRRSKDLVMIVDSFMGSGLSCYKKRAVENFISRFRFELSDKNAKRFILSLISESSQKFRSWVYDQYQKLTNNIAF
jgi:phosphatidylinositol 4-kinase A